jgi:SsrA-binding protein
MKVVSTNKYANFNYFILETFEAGIVLKGSEVKSIRINGITLNESFIIIKNNQVLLKNSLVKNYQTSNAFTPKVDRDRQLLLNKNEILKLRQKTEQKGLTIVPIKAYFKGDRLKLEIGIGRGKKLYNKKEDKKEQDIKRETQRLLAEQCRVSSRVH